MDIKQGQTIEGQIKRLVDEAAFVDVGAGRPVVISRKDIEQVEDEPQVDIEVGETVPVYIYHMPERGGDPLGSIAKAIEKGNAGSENGSDEGDLWESVEEKYRVGDLVEGAVTTIKRFGAFVKLPLGVEGLIHVSELEPGFTRSPWDVVQSGDKVRVSIIKIEPERQRIGLSLDAVL